MELTDIVAELEPLLLSTLDGIVVNWTPAGVTAHLSFCLFVPVLTHSRLPHHDVTLDTSDVPPEVSVAGSARWPDLVKPLSTDVDIETQIRDLDRSRLVGRLDASRFDCGAPAARRGLPPITWVVKTHAGSDAERIAWVKSLPRSPLA